MEFDKLVQQARRSGKNASDPVTYGDLFAIADGAGSTADVPDEDGGRGEPQDAARAGNPMGAGGFGVRGEGRGRGDGSRGAGNGPRSQETAGGATGGQGGGDRGSTGQAGPGGGGQGGNGQGGGSTDPNDRGR